MAKKTPDASANSQYQRFVEAAKSAGCDEDPAHFDEALKKVARHKPKSPDAVKAKGVKKEPKK